MQAPYVHPMNYQPVQYIPPQYLPQFAGMQQQGMPQYAAPQYAAPQYAAPQFTLYMQPGAQPQQPPNAEEKASTPKEAPTPTPVPLNQQPSLSVNPIINVPAPAPFQVQVQETREAVTPEKKPQEASEDVEKVEKPWRRFLDRETPEIRQVYEFGSILGRGSTSIVRQVKDRNSGAEFACKSMAKAKMTKRQHVDDMKREIQVSI